ncbi:hypothetical protein GCM10009789_26740 [Kribbella sancticallisti]|uniref:Uncharacterized protein n=1 Tax=Kribbella sancticallisti TaxID=460087 RepID=A0ABP4P569_9ACTN
MLPASPKISGGSERIAKKAASAARPVTRYRRQVPTVWVINIQIVPGIRRAHASETEVSDPERAIPLTVLTWRTHSR